MGRGGMASAGRMAGVGLGEGCGDGGVAGTFCDGAAPPLFCDGGVAAATGVDLRSAWASARRSFRAWRARRWTWNVMRWSRSRRLYWARTSGGMGAVEGHFIQEDGIAGGDGVGKAVGEVAVGEAGELGGVGGEFAGGFEKILGGEPVEEAAIVPFGEVLGANRDAGEMLGEEGLDFGEGVEPLNEFHAGFAVVEALVELVAELVRETGDFAGAFHDI